MNGGKKSGGHGGAVREGCRTNVFGGHWFDKMSHHQRQRIVMWVDGFKCIWLILKSGSWTGGTCGLVDQVYIYISVLLAFIAPFNFLLCFKAEMV